MTRLATRAYLDHLAADSERFAAVLAPVDAATRVPTCPDWDADDLLWHLAEVQWFWGTIVSGRRASPEGIDDLRVARPGERAELQAWYATVSADLQRALAETPPGTPVWTWASDHTVGFVVRRQAHEALIHRLDAELTAGARTPMDAALAADGVDEILRVMYGGDPGWGTFTPQHAVRVTATDTGDSWLVRPGRFTGTSRSGNAVDDPDLRVDAPPAAAPPSGVDSGELVDGGGPVDAEVSGTAEDLDCWLWHRPVVGTIARTGDPTALAALDAAISSGID